MMKIENRLEGCVPYCVTPFLKVGQENFASEIRSLTVMFVSLGVDLNTASTDAGKEKI